MVGLDWDGRASRVGVVSLETTTASDTDSGRHFLFYFFYSVCRGDMLHIPCVGGLFLPSRRTMLANHRSQ